jgi:hypothetical protein
MDDLQQLRHFVKLANAYEDSLEKKEKPETRKRKPKTEMMAQTQFPRDGPALFMEGSRLPYQVTPGVNLWKQPRDYEEQPSRRVLRLRKGVVPRITSS